MNLQSGDLQQKSHVSSGGSGELSRSCNVGPLTSAPVARAVQPSDTATRASPSYPCAHSSAVEGSSAAQSCRRIDSSSGSSGSSAGRCGDHAPLAAGAEANPVRHRWQRDWDGPIGHQSLLACAIRSSAPAAEADAPSLHRVHARRGRVAVDLQRDVVLPEPLRAHGGHRTE